MPDTKTDLAAQRYRGGTTNNRQVASTLEAEWNTAFRALQDVQQDYEHHRQSDRLLIDDQVRTQVIL